MMAAVLALAVFFCDSFVAEAAGSISLATASVKTYGNDDDVWSFIETSGYGSESKLPLYLKDDYYDVLKELCPRIKGNGDGTVTIKWNPVSGANQYEISLTDDSKSKYEKVCYDRINSTSYTFKMKDTPAIGPYYLQIRALDRSGNAIKDTHFLTVHFPDWINKCETLPEPTEIEAKVNGTSITIQFKRVSYAKDYTILFDGNEYAVTKNPSSSGLYSYTINNLVPGKDYKYSIRANFHSKIGIYTTILPKYDYKSIPGEYGPVRSTATVQKPVGTPKINSKSATETSVTVSWSAATNAAAYDLSIDGQKYTTTDLQKTVTGLTPGKTYKVFVTAKNEYNTSQSQTVDVVTPAQSPTDVSVTCEETKATLRWSAQNGVSRYELVYYIDGKENKMMVSATSSPSVTITGLTPSKEYTYKIRCVSPDGIGEYGQLSKFKTKDIVKINAVPTFKSVKANGTTANLEWSEVTGATKYELIFDNVTYTCNYNSKSISGLTPGTTYRYKVRGINDFAQGPYSTEYSIAMPPNPPADFNYESTEDRVTLSWSKVSGITGYVVSFDGKEYEYSSQATSATFTNLKIDTAYSANIACKNTYGVGNRKYLTDIRTKKGLIEIGAPSIKNETVSDKTISFAWSAVEGAKEYEISINGNTYKTTALQFTLGGLYSNREYSYQVRGINGKYVGPYTSAKTLKTLPDPPTPTATPSYDSVRIEWPKQSGAQAYYLKFNGTEYEVTENYKEFTGLKPNTSYTYQLNAKWDNGRTYYGKTYAVLTKSTKPAYPAPVLISKKVLRDDALVKWEPVEGASEYEIEINGVVSKEKNTGTFIRQPKNSLVANFRIRAVGKSGVGEYSPMYTIKFPPEGPTNIRATSTFNTITVSWNPVSGVAGYIVNEKYVVGSYQTSYTITGLNANTSYSYSVACLTEDGYNYDYADRNTKRITTQSLSLDAPTGIKDEAYGSGIRVSWNPVKNAESYIVKYGNSQWTVKGTSRNFSGYKPEEEFKYSVAAVAAGVTGPFSEVITTYFPLSKPTGLTARVYQEAVLFNWSRDYRYDAAGYEIWINGTTYRIQGDVPTYTLENPSGEKIRCKVRSISKHNKYSLYSDEVTVQPAPGLVTGIKAVQKDDGIHISWNPSTGAEKYVVSMSYTPNYETTDCEIRIPNYYSGTTYTIRVYAQNASGMNRNATPISFTTNVGIPVFDRFGTRATSNSARIAWSECSTAIAYEVIFDGKTYRTENNSITIDGLEPNSVHRYKVRAIAANNQSKYTEEAEITLLPEKPETPTNIRAEEHSHEIILRWDECPYATSYVIAFGDNSITVYSNYARITGLMQNTEYKYQVRANNISGSSQYSAVQYAHTLLEQPIIKEAKLDGDKIIVRISEVPDAESYVFTFDGQEYETKNTSVVIEGLEPNTNYSLSVKAKNKEIDGEVATKEIVTESLTPGVPSGINATATKNSVVISWKEMDAVDSYDINFGEETYHIEPKKKSSGINMSAVSSESSKENASIFGKLTKGLKSLLSDAGATIQSITANGSKVKISDYEEKDGAELSQVFLNLVPGCIYEYSIRANNKYGSGQYSATNYIKTLDGTQSIYNSDYDYEPSDGLMTYFDGKKRYASADPIDSVTGAFMWTNSVIEDFGAADLHFDVFYNSGISVGDIRDLRDVGAKWSHTFDYTLNIEGGNAYFKTPYDSLITFVYDGKGYKNSDGLTNTTFAEKDGKYVVNTSDKSYFVFDKNHRLSEIGKNGKAVYRFSWDDEFNTMKVSTEKLSYIEFSYSQFRVDRVKDSLGNEAKFKYEDGFLKSITSSEGSVASFEYDDNGLLTKIVGYDGETYLSNIYDARGRVINQKIAGRGETTAFYNSEDRVNRFTDELGNVTSYMYDEAGRIICVNADERYFYNEFDENGRLYKQIDSEGNETLTEYDVRGRICKITYPDGTYEETSYNDADMPISVKAKDGTVVTYEYDDKGKLKQYTDKRGNVSTYNYDISGNLLKYTDNLGNEWRYEYDNFSHLTKSIDPEGNTSNFTYDRAGRLTSVIAPNGSKTYYEYSPAGHLLSERDGEGKIEYSYDVNGNLTKIKDKQGNEKTFAYDEMGNLLMEKDEEGNAYYYSYDEAGNLIKTFCPDDSIEEIEYDSYGFVSATKDKNGNLTSFEYDKNGNVIKETDALGSAFEYEYDSMGQLILSKDPLGYETRYSYDAMGRIISITDPLGFIVSYTYDENGNVLSKTDEEGNTTFFEYDAENQLIKTTDATGSSYVNYDKAGNVTSVIDKEENEESYSYDKEGNVISSLDKNGNRWTYNYDIYGRLISEMAPNFALTKYEYDKNGNCVSMTDALERTITYEHNAVGQLTKEIDSLGNETSYKYDAMGRVREVTDANGNVTKLRYDANSNLIESENPVGGIQTYTYDELNRCIGGTDEEGNSWSYTYDALGNKTSYTDPNGNVVRFAYDADNRLTTVTDQNGETLNYSYTKTGSVSKLIDEEGAETSYEYDALGRVVKILDALGNSTTFTYDKNGNVLTRTDANQNTYSFEYSPLGELIKEIDPLGNETKYKYDAIGSLISKTDANGNETKYEYDALGQPIKVTDSRGAETKFSYTPDGHISKVEDALGNINTYSYDACGNLLKTTDALGNVIRYEYDALNNCIKEYSDENGNEESVTLYEYDKKGRCIKEITPLSYVKEYKYDGNGNVISSTDEEGREIKVSYDLNNNPLTKTYNDGTTVSYRYNKRGELVEVTDWTGVTSFERNILGQVTKVTEFDGKSVGYDYDGVGNVVKIEYPDGKVVSYGYDKNDRISTIKDGESVLSEYAYDAVGNVVSIKGPNSEQFYEYSKTNLPTKLKTYVNGYEEEIESYTYDLLGRMTVLEREGKSGRDSISYHYDAAGELTKAVYDNKTEEYLYDARGNRIQKLVNGELFESYTYNTGNELISKSDSLHNYIYEYDKCGNLVKESTDGETSIEYTYNLDGKMTLGKNLVTGEETAYTYNALGMMVSHAAVYNEDILPILENAIPETIPEIVDPNEEIEETIPGAIIPDTDVSGNDETLNTPETPDNVTVPDVSYNDTGAPVTTSFTEGIPSVDVPGVSGNEIEDLDVLPDVNITDESNDILSLEDDSNLENEIVIEEPTAELLEKEPREITERVVDDYLSDSRNVLYKESTADGAVRYVYGNAFEQIAIGREESYTAVLSDIYLTPFAFVDNNDGEYTNIGHVDAWGNSFDDDESERYFTSYEFDPVIGKYFAKARFYDPTTGRMISPDPVKRSLNPYYYCENDPANKVDSDGEIAEWLVAGAVNGVVRGALGIAESYISQIGNGKSFAEKTKNALAHGANEGIKGFASGATAVIAGTPIAAAVNFVAGAAGDALEQYITTGSVDVKQSVKAGATNTVRELIYRGGKCPLSDFGTAIGKGALSKGAEAAIDYAVDAAAYSINKAKKKNSTTATDTQTQPITYDSKYSLSNGSKKTSSFEVSYGSQQVRGYNEEEKNPYSLAGFLKHTAKGALEGAAENAVFYGVEKVFGAAKNVLSCFVAGTLIKTSEGLIPIEEIRVGDEVFAYNVETGETELKEVKQLFVHEEDELVHLVINGEKIDTTTNHPFFVEDLGFVSAKDLQVGDELSLYDGSTATVEHIEVEILEESVLVYNFEVDDWHTYFVGNDCVLVHNDCGSVKYGELDSLGRATGVEAVITQDMIGTGSPAKSSIKPAGFGGQAQGYARGHLLGNQLGGSGSDPRNLTTIYQNPVNHPVMSSVEASVRKAVEGGQVVNYNVTPIYKGNNLISRGITIRATGDNGFSIYQTILNGK